jgi:hypothetical protein
MLLARNISLTRAGSCAAAVVENSIQATPLAIHRLNIIPLLKLVFFGARCAKIHRLRTQNPEGNRDCCILVTVATQNTIGSILVLDFLRYVISVRRRVVSTTLPSNGHKLLSS